MATYTKGNLVLYRERPALVRGVGEKLEIELEGGKLQRVRPKDLALLHEGPIRSLGELQTPDGDVETAWELLDGNATDIAELADLAYGDYTPHTAWAAWQQVAHGLYFRGRPEQIETRSPADVAQERSAREAKAARKRGWAEFIDRLRQKRTSPSDQPYLEEIERVALGRRSDSPALRELGRSEKPESAHALLLELGYWDHTRDPYPGRAGVATAPPETVLPEVPEQDRVDLTHLPAFAIDDEDCQDPDDALSLDGGRLWVHVADVAAVVTPGSPADLEARARGASVYLPEGTVPMLPTRAAEILGLGASDVSPALSFGLDLAGEGGIQSVEVVPSLVRVTRLTYAEAEAQLDREPFGTLLRLAQTYSERRRANGAVTIDLPEAKVTVVDGRVVVQPLPPLASRTLVQEGMLMAGEAAGRFVVEHDIPFPFSTQDPPQPRERPEGLAGMFDLRRSLKPSQLRSVPAAHAGLGLPVYAQCTSPLRRYLDLVAHQQLRAHLGGGELLDPQQLLERVGAAEAVAASVRRAGREACRHWTLVCLLEQPEWRGRGVLVHKRGSGGTVLIPELALEARVYLREELPLNAEIGLALTEVNLPELQAHFQIER